MVHEVMSLRQWMKAGEGADLRLVILLVFRTLALTHACLVGPLEVNHVNVRPGAPFRGFMEWVSGFRIGFKD